LSTPPHDPEAERALLGSLLLDPSILDQVRTGPDEFYDTRHGSIWRCALELHRKGSAVDEVTLLAELRRVGALDRVGGEAYLAELARKVPSASAFADYEHSVSQHAVRRYCLSIARTLEAGASDPGSDVGVIVAEAVTGLRETPLNGAARRVALVPMSSVRAKPVRWLWPGFIPHGKTTIVFGDPEAGKSLFSVWLAARITTGDPLPDPNGATVERREPARVFLLTAEDDIEDTVAPRLIAAGADRERVLCLQGARRGTVTLDDIEAAEEALLECQPALFVFDPIQAFLPHGRIDWNAQAEVRPIMQRFQGLAERTGTAVVLIAHITKAVQGGRALARIVGSGDVGAAARSALYCGRIDGADGRTEHAVVPAKASLAKRRPGISYEIVGAQVETDEGPADVGLFRYLGRSELTERDLLAAREGDTKLAEAEDFVTEQLRDGPVAQKDVEAAAKREGISMGTLRRAKKRRHVISERCSLEGEERGKGHFVWSLPHAARHPEAFDLDQAGPS